MEIKEIWLHRADGSIDKHTFPVIVDDEENTGGTTTPENPDTGGNTGGESGGDTTPATLWVYKSGDKNFTNVNGHGAVDGSYVQFPPHEDDGRGSGNIGDITQDHFKILYTNVDESSLSADYDFYAIGLTETFENYSKLCIEAKFPEWGRLCELMNVGYTDIDTSHDNADWGGIGGMTFGNITQGISTERKVYEFDISHCVESNSLHFTVVSGIALQIYNIWLEK